MLFPFMYSRWQHKAAALPWTNDPVWMAQHLNAGSCDLGSRPQLYVCAVHCALMTFLSDSKSIRWIGDIVIHVHV